MLFRSAPTAVATAGVIADAATTVPRSAVPIEAASPVPMEKATTSGIAGMLEFHYINVHGFVFNFYFELLEWQTRHLSQATKPIFSGVGVRHLDPNVF